MHPLLLALVLALLPAPAPPWGEGGHLMIGRAAADALPPEMPPFFRDAAARLSYLNPEPDRWKARDERTIDPAMDAAHSPEHYVDLEF